MGEPIRFWLVYRVACPDDANRWSCFADEVNARSICATANKAWGEGTWDVRAATLDSDAAAYHRGLADAAGIVETRATEHDKAAIGLRECGHDGSEEHEAESYVAIELRSAERAIRRAAGGQG